MSDPATTALRLAPCTIKAAKRWVAQTHRHLPEFNGARFAVAVVDDAGEIHGVAVASNGPRVWEGTGRLNIGRVSTDGTKDACSMLYGAICRAGKALGYTEAWTYTLPSEPGTSLRAAGFEEVGESAGGSHDRKGRPRHAPVQGGPKRRWRRILNQERAGGK